MENKKIYIVGDVHADWGNLNKLINKRSPDLILQCGDFGYWPNETYKKGREKINYGYAETFVVKEEYYWKEGHIKNHDTEIRWCDGNHENFYELGRRESDEVFPGVIYQPRGSVLTLPDGRNVLFMGGGLSIDKHYRTEGRDWFPEEGITQKDIYNLPDVKIDIVISHTCPEEFLYKIDVGLKVDDPSNKALSSVLERYQPDQWFFGHFHQYKTGYKAGCEFTCLDMLGGREKCWEILK